MATIDDDIANIFKVRNSIVENIKATGNIVGAVDCPLCEGKVSYSQATSNGHIHAQCSTKDCVNWVE